MQKCELRERDPRAPKFEEGTQDATSKQERCARRKAWDLGEKCLQARESGQNYVLLSCRSQGELRNENWWLTPEHPLRSSKKGLKLRRTANSSKIQEAHNGGNGHWGSDE